tara:strand:+ start:901 stop:1689 length:789 start_codon:yes stop_codon:yes gene_type:complete
MITIPRKLKINNYQEVDYEVFPKKEFKLKYKHWKDCKEGEWGISDDGYIAQCLAVKTYASGIEMTYPYGKQWVTKTSKLEFEPHWESKNFNSVSTKSNMELELQKRRSKDVLDAYMTYIFAGKTPDFDKLGQMYRPDQKKPAWTVKRLLKTKGMKQMIKDKMKEVLTERGIDEGYVLDTIKDAIGVAKVNEDPGNMIKAAKELSDYLDMKPKAKTQTDTLELDLSHQIEANFEKQTKKLTATKTQELPSETENNDIREERES